MNKDSNRAKRIVQQLGMSQGAAQGQLRKRILFNFLVRLKENWCFKCSKEIERVDDLSVEHKQPWENISADLFWDLENIAFSHIQCNRQHTNGAEKLRKVGPTGTSWCHKHKKFLPTDKFWKNSGNWNGVRRECIDCYNERDKDARVNHAKISV